METTKEIYEAPLCTVIEVDAQEVICTSGTHQGFKEGSCVVCQFILGAGGYHGGQSRPIMERFGLVRD